MPPFNVVDDGPYLLTSAVVELFLTDVDLVTVVVVVVVVRDAEPVQYRKTDRGYTFVEISTSGLGLYCRRNHSFEHAMVDFTRFTVKKQHYIVFFC